MSRIHDYMKILIPFGGTAISAALRRRPPPRRRGTPAASGHTDAFLREHPPCVRATYCRDLLRVAVTHRKGHPPCPIEIDSITVNQGFIPEGLAFWRRWRHPEPA